MKKETRLYIILGIFVLLTGIFFLIGRHADSRYEAGTQAAETPDETPEVISGSGLAGAGEVLTAEAVSGQDPASSPSEDPAEAVSEDAAPYTVTDASGQSLSLGEETGQYMVVGVEELQEYASTSVNMWEFVQRFYRNIIVYKNEDGFVYEPVDRSLPMSDYDWNCLVEKGLDTREVEYVENGEVKSLKGIDVSRYQNEIDWKKVAADGVKYAFIRLGYRGYSTGKLVLDEKFDENVTGALENGIAVGVYFVTQAVSVEEAEEEAQFVLDTIAPYHVTWPVVLDIEAAGSEDARTALLTKEQRTDFIVAFCEKVRTAGKTPMLYANIRWFVECMDLSRLTAYDKWFAQYFNRPFFPYEFQIWQYTSSGSVAGIEGNADLNISFVDYGKEE